LLQLFSSSFERQFLRAFKCTRSCFHKFPLLARCFSSACSAQGEEIAFFPTDHDVGTMPLA
jgi:hypothetical protein